MAITNLTYGELAVVGAVFAFSLGFFRTIYHLYFHPLAGFPGPKLAIISPKLWGIYYNIYYDGAEVFLTNDLHDKYGPIIRAAPDQLHIRDIDAYNEIFKIGTKYLKSQAFYNHPMLAKSLLCIHDPKEARLRRDALGSYFSKQAVRSLEPTVVVSNLKKFLARVADCAQTSKPFDCTRAYRCLTADIITEYSYAKSFGALDHPDFFPRFLHGFEAATSTVWTEVYFKELVGVVTQIALRLPLTLLNATIPVLHDILEFQADCRQCVSSLKREHDAGTNTSVTIFGKMLDDDPKTGRKAASEDVLTDEAFLTVSAGMDTTGHALTVATHNIIRSPDVQKKLLEELRTVMPKPKDICEGEKLEQLPYLTAVIKETLRLSNGVPGGLPRNSPPGGAMLAGKFIPGNTIIHNSAYCYHNNPAVFPGPEKFDPARWLQADTKLQEQHLIPFSRGSRICIGMNLAWAELFLAIGHIFRRFDMSFIGSQEEADEIMKWGDHFVPVTKGILKVHVEERVD